MEHMSVVKKIGRYGDFDQFGSLVKDSATLGRLPRAWGQTPFRPKVRFRGSEWALWLRLVAFVLENGLRSYGHFNRPCLAQVKEQKSHRNGERIRLGTMSEPTVRQRPSWGAVQSARLIKPSETARMIPPLPPASPHRGPVRV